MALRGLVASLHELEEFYRNDEAGAVIELMNQTNDIMTDVPLMESNQTNGHLTRIRTGLPAVYWTRLYEGTLPSKGTYSHVTEPCGMLESRFYIDERECSLYGDKAKAFRLSESTGHAEAMRQEVAKTLFYGDTAVTPEKFNGLAKRYPASDAPNVIDASKGIELEEGEAVTSLWFISWGDRTVHGLYPKHTKAGLSTEDLGRQTVSDDKGGRYEALEEKHIWQIGLAVRDWRACVRIANIPVNRLSFSAGETGFIDLRKLTVQAKNMMPETMRQNGVWYCNQDVLTALELQSTDPQGVHLTYGEYFDSKTIPVIHGRPIRQCDAISSSEDIIQFLVQIKNKNKQKEDQHDIRQ